MNTTTTTVLNMPSLRLLSYRALAFWNVSLALLVAVTMNLHAREFCEEKQILDGSEQLVSYGLDSTTNWWAVTMPYDSLYRLWINGQKSETYDRIQSLVFSPDGEHWAAWASMRNQWHLLHDGRAESVVCTAPGELHFSYVGGELTYSVFEGSQEIIERRRQKHTVLNRVDRLYTSYGGEHLAWVISQAGSKSFVVDGRQGSQYDDLKLFGFWTDGALVYAALSGSQWRIYRGDEEVAGPFLQVTEPCLNVAGTVGAAIVSQGSDREVVLFADEYTRPLFSRQYEQLDALVLHPTLPMWAARSQLLASGLVIMTGAEYSAGSVATGEPKFTADGKELFYFGCDSECFISINGKKTPINQVISADGTFAHKSGSSTFAYSTTSSLVFREIERKDLWVSRMCDETSLPRYNWRSDKYEALGRINQRLYLLQCMN